MAETKKIMDGYGVPCTVKHMQPWPIGKCDVCGTEGPTAVCSSLFGATSYAYCSDCFDVSKEPYQAIVAYISSAGYWPDDINEGYQREVRRQLRLHGKPEEIFKFDVERAIAEEQAFIKEYCAGKIDLEEVMKGGGDLF